MKISIFEKWLDYPEGQHRPFKLVGSSKLRLDTKKHSSVKILARLANVAKVPQCYEGKSLEKRYLVLLVDKDYENSLVGTLQQIHSLVRDCLVDEGLMSKSWGRKA